MKKKTAVFLLMADARVIPRSWVFISFWKWNHGCIQDKSSKMKICCSRLPSSEIKTEDATALLQSWCARFASLTKPALVVVVPALIMIARRPATSRKILACNDAGRAARGEANNRAASMKAPGPLWLPPRGSSITACFFGATQSTIAASLPRVCIVLASCACLRPDERNDVTHAARRCKEESRQHN